MQSGFLNKVPFDPLSLRTEQMQEKEVKNGRLAMVAFVGFASQAAVQGKGPIASLKYHIADPFHRNSKPFYPLRFPPAIMLVFTCGAFATKAAVQGKGKEPLPA